MKKKFLFFILFGLITITTASTAFADITETMPLTRSAMELRITMRKLWEDHITYTRNYIISDLANLNDKSKIAERLLKNQVDIGDAIKPFYGDEAGTKLTSLLKEHIMIATKVVGAAKKNQTKALAKASEEWSKNGDDIAFFLSSANANWKKSDMQEMFTKHLSLTTDEVVSRLKKNWDKDIEAYDKGHEHMLIFSDELTIGIIKQYPDKFKE
ncbi:MAG: hypothetical protein PHY93_18195 [Bacteriovorax sp.]|nr:hypothetical protein [Bacteriovorax sp.]